MLRDFTGARWFPVAWVTAGSGLQRGLAALLIIVILAIANRGSGLDSAGTIGVSAAIALVAAAVADFGTTLATLREFSLASPSRHDFMRVLQIKVLLGVLVAAVLAAGAALLAPGEWAAALAVAALIIPLSAVVSTATSKLVTGGDGTSLSVAAVFSFAAGSLVAGGVSLITHEPWALIIALPAARAVEAAILLTSCVFPPLEVHRSSYDWRWLRRAWPLSAHWLLQVGYLRAQVIVPGVILSATGAGAVASGFNLYSAGTLLPGAFAQATLPAVARATERSLADGLRHVVRLSLISLAMIAPASVVIAIFPERIVDLVYGSTATGLVAYLRWTAAAMLLVGPNGLMLSLLIASRHNRQAALIWLGALVAGCALLAVCASLWGVAGAGFAVFASEVLVAALLGRAVWVAVRRPATAEDPDARPLHIPRRIGAALIVFAAALVAGAAVPLLGTRYAFPDPETGLLLLLGLPVVIFIALRALHYDLLAPGSIFALTWATAIGVAQIPLYPFFTWTAEMWFLVGAGPVLWFATATLVSGGLPRLPREPGEVLTAAWRAPAGLLVLFALIGLFAWIRYYATVGAAPLVSGQIDAIRFSEFDAFTLVGTRFGHVAVIACLFFAAITPSRRTRWILLAAGGAALIPIVLSGGRLYAVSTVASAAMAILIVRTVNWRIAAAVLLGGALVLVASTAVWFARIDQQAANPFKDYLDNYLVESRPAWLQWSIPVQLAAAGSVNTLADLVETKAFLDHQHDGLYSFRAFDRFLPSADLEDVTREHARFNQVTSTYLGEFYADFGLTGALLASVGLGGVYALIYRLMRGGRSLVWTLVYAYAAFWIIFSAYLGYWTTHGVWLADIPLLIVVALVASRRPALARAAVPVLPPVAAGADPA